MPYVDRTKKYTYSDNFKYIIDKIYFEKFNF